MKKLILIAAALVAATGLCACGSAPESHPDFSGTYEVVGFVSDGEDVFYTDVPESAQEDLDALRADLDGFTLFIENDHTATITPDIHSTIMESIQFAYSWEYNDDDSGIILTSEESGDSFAVDRDGYYLKCPYAATDPVGDNPLILIMQDPT